MRLKTFLAMTMLFGTTCIALADDDYAELKKQGYEDWKVTTIKEPFKGCRVGDVIKFDNDLSFQCTEGEEHEAKEGNKVTILKHPLGFYKVFIGNEDYNGQLMGVK